MERSRIYVFDMASFEDRSVPGAFAVGTSIDEPGIELSTVRVEPELTTRRKWLDCMASVAGQPWSRGALWLDCPLYPLNCGHDVLFFPMGSSSRRRNESPTIGGGVAVVQIEGAFPSPRFLRGEEG